MKVPRERRPKIECPFCHSFDSDVVGGDWDTCDEWYVRRRKCRGCGEILETVELLRVTAKKFAPVQDMVKTA